MKAGPTQLRDPFACAVFPQYPAVLLVRSGLGLWLALWANNLNRIQIIVISGPEWRDDVPVRERETAESSAHSNRAHERESPRRVA
jgi:hypothetical protein